MSCDKIDPGKVSLNGASSAYGGSISNLTLNFGLLSAGTNATVTLVGSSMSSPVDGDGFTVGIMGLDLAMQVAGYTFTSSAAGATTLRLTLKDKSNLKLDNKFIVRNEEVPKGLPADSVSYLGTKYGTLPNDVAIELGILIPASDTMWGGLRKYFEDIQIAYNFWYKPWNAAPMTDAVVEEHIRSANGKTIWTADELKKVLVEDDLFGAEGDSEKEIEKLPFPQGSFQLDGSYREVVMGVANSMGWVVYWDCETNRLGFVNEISSSAGYDVLDTLADKCEVVGSSNSSDFTTSLSVGAIGSFSTNSSDTQNQKSQGGKMAKFFRGTPLTPTFHYSSCFEKMEDFEKDDLFVIDPNDADTQKAFYASWHEEFYSMYVLQSVLKAKAERGDEADTVVPAGLIGPFIPKGRQNFLAAIDFKLNEATIVDPCSTYTVNSLFKNRYIHNEIGNTKDCAQGVWAIFFSDDADMSAANDGMKQLANETTGWNSPAKVNFPPFKVAGKWDGLFEAGYHVVRRKDSAAFTSILGDSGLNGVDDPLRLYLNAIYRFSNIFHVIKDGSSLRSAVDVDDSFYNYYMTQDAQGPGLAITAPNGFDHRPTDPYLRVNECGISELIELFKACQLMYTGNCDLEEMKATAIIDWIRVLDRNQIKMFFGNPGQFQKSRKGPFSQKELDETCNSNPMMHLFVQPSREDPGIGSISGSDANSEACFGGNVGGGAGQDNATYKQIADFVLGSGAEEGLFTPFEEKFQSFVITDTDIGAEAKLLSPAGKKDRVKAWIDIEGTMGTLTTGPGPHYMCAAKMPSGGVWTSKLNRGISIDAADIAKKVGESESESGGGGCYAASAANEAKAYSDFMLANMFPELEAKVNAHAWTDTTAAAARTMTIVLGDNFSDITLPTLEEGLEALAITNSNGKIEISITVGNSFERAAKKAMFELMASVPALQHVASPHIPDTFIGGASPKLVQISKGMI